MWSLLKADSCNFPVNVSQEVLTKSQEQVKNVPDRRNQTDHSDTTKYFKVTTLVSAHFFEIHYLFYSLLLPSLFHAEKNRLFPTP